VSQKLKLGDRVRTTHLNRATPCPPGVTGTVTWGPSAGSELTYYVVKMDQGSGGRPAVFIEDEIEPAA
jgi:hypothetical protein